ncbi:hypothetical protein R3P38DRAFT_2888096 [Favolaschia claudopus]|uniref:Uncharacterized protein n=1 Tax=Favolaschia claudopus TaxID=2862362 RepID=A0AAW0CRU3_9AGAR
MNRFVTCDRDGSTCGSIRKNRATNQISDQTVYKAANLPHDGSSFLSPPLLASVCFPFQPFILAHAASTLEKLPEGESRSRITSLVRSPPLALVVPPSPLFLHHPLPFIVHPESKPAILRTGSPPRQCCLARCTILTPVRSSPISSPSDTRLPRLRFSPPCATFPNHSPSQASTSSYWFPTVWNAVRVFQAEMLPATRRRLGDACHSFLFVVIVVVVPCRGIILFPQYTRSQVTLVLPKHLQRACPKSNAQSHVLIFGPSPNDNHHP